ncbi:MAG: nucleotide exchange factor GrpE [Deltaproteobacteria bacterium]|nr:nucleotide exchange factor GrpE [Deltaproteobacteria bacterium]
MAQDNGKGSFSADIPQSLLDEALDAVEKKEEVQPPPAGAEPSELDKLRAQLELSMAAGKDAFEKLKEEHDRRLRAVADLENYRKRVQREKEELERFANERILKDILPVVDNLDRALAAAAADDPLAGGVKLVLKVLEEALGRNGVRSFHALGEPFDPKVHEAIMAVPAGDKPPGTVVIQHGRGFLLNDRLVRPALVAVAAPPAQDGDGKGNAG